MQASSSMQANVCSLLIPLRHQVFNEYLLRPSHGATQSSYAHLRVMDIDKWLNSKIFFKCVV
jgi:hypothetical protein